MSRFLRCIVEGVGCRGLPERGVVFVGGGPVCRGEYREDVGIGPAGALCGKKLDRARDDLERLGRGLGSRQPPLPRRRDVTTRITAISRVRKVGAYLRTAVGTDPETGKPTLAWHYDEHALATEAATDGWYALLTNLPPEITAAEVLRR